MASASVADAFQMGAEVDDVGSTCASSGCLITVGTDSAPLIVALGASHS